MFIKKYIYNGKVFVTIVNEHCCPVDPLVSNYINSQLLVKSINTQIRYINELIFILKFFHSQSLDLIEIISNKNYLTHQEYQKFYEASFFNTSLSNAASSDSNIINLAGKSFRNTLSANSRNTLLVANETIRGRLTRLRDFMDYLFNFFHSDSHSYEISRLQHDKLVKKIKHDESRFKVNYSYKPIEFYESVLPDDKFNRLLEIIKPFSSENPFKSSKLRNYLIVKLLIETGIRRGSLAKMKISDCLFHGDFNKISIHKEYDDRSDPRINRPKHKTKSHISSVNTETMKALKYYIDHIRSAYPRSIEHDFIFISEKDCRNTAGLPLSMKSINAIFERISKSMKFHVHPHLLRHKWNEIFDKKGSSLGIDAEELEDIRKYAMGWSQNTKMNQIYNDKRLAEKAHDISMKHQGDINDKN